MKVGPIRRISEETFRLPRGLVSKFQRRKSGLALGAALLCAFASHGCKRHIYVDVIPPPPAAGVCENPKATLLSMSIHSRAHWEKSHRHWIILLNVHIVSTETRMWFGWLKAQDVQVSGATVYNMTLEPQDIELALVPLEGKSQTLVLMPVLCDDNHLSLRVKFDLSGRRKKNGYIPTDLIDSAGAEAGKLP